MYVVEQVLEQDYIFELDVESTKELVKSSSAAKRFIRLVQLQSKINYCSQEGKEIVCFQSAQYLLSYLSHVIFSQMDFKGEITFDHVSFNYPSRPKVTILNEFTLDIKEGHRIAIL
ncbi:unnamed protein product, partial [Didymodactylos carnosus]